MFSTFVSPLDVPWHSLMFGVQWDVPGILKNNRYEAKKYIDKCPVDTKVNYFVRIASFEDAVQVAIQLKSEEAFQFIEGSCKGRRDVLKMIADARGGGGR
eukprot:m.975653 g.975653  ORF g.975653 m.975653 type:complete len:100 (+) comp23942_c1_seq5:2840-3139(+)